MNLFLMSHQFSLGAELRPTNATLESNPALANTLGLQGGLHCWAKEQGFKKGIKNMHLRKIINNEPSYSYLSYREVFN